MPKIMARQERSAAYKERDKLRAREKRKAARMVNPAKTTRIFTCKQCSSEWETAELGNFKLCPPCRGIVEEIDLRSEEERRQKVCPECQASFKDETDKFVQHYCNEECRRRAKLKRSGKVSTKGFLADRTLTCIGCMTMFTPKRDNQIYCTVSCRDVVYGNPSLESRAKHCKVTGEAFLDTSLRNNRQYAIEEARKRVGVKVDAARLPHDSEHTEVKRMRRERSGLGGRIDDIRTLRKYTASWWGRASETIFSVYRRDADDMVLEYGATSPFDFYDEDLGRVEVRGRVRTKSPEGADMWVFHLYGLFESCDHVFFIGYSPKKDLVEHIWVIPSAKVSSTSVRFVPSSKHYQWAQYDVAAKWGLSRANAVLAQLHSLPEPERPTDRFAWMDDPKQFEGDSPPHRGRRGEFLYQEMYPMSIDTNRQEGPNSLWDFLDPDGTKINVKTSRYHKSRHRWSFAVGRTTDNKCDVFSCICLAEDAKTVLREYRIPVAVWGDRRTLHIFENSLMWEPYRTI
jgi:hypothetical protein